MGDWPAGQRSPVTVPAPPSPATPIRIDRDITIVRTLTILAFPSPDPASALLPAGALLPSAEPLKRGQRKVLRPWPGAG